MIAAVRIICEPWLCWVQPSAYITVMVRVGEEVEAMYSHTFRNLSCGVPVIFDTISGV